MRRPIVQAFVLSGLVLAVFWPAVYAEFLIIDDQPLIAGLKNVQEWALEKLLFPNRSGGMYYRPLIHVSYRFDRFVFDLSPFWMHLHNILLHLGNVLLVWALARKVLGLRGEAAKVLPFVAAFLFAIHPLVTESVNWVSGRTDLIAGLFILASAWAVLHYRQTGRIIWLGLALLGFLGGMLTKEVALAFLPAALLLLCVETRPSKSFLQRLKSIRLWRNFGLFVLFAGVAFTFIWLRLQAYTSNKSQIGLTLKIIINDPMYNALMAVRALGFYLKKILLPWPLNFAIVEIDPLYDLLGLPALVLVVIYLLVRWDLLAGLLASGLCLLSPSFLIALNQIAWVPYAERYLYIPLAFIALPLVMFLVRVQLEVRKYRVPVGALILAGLLLTYGYTTIQRNLVWQNNMTILADTVAKSPGAFLPQLVYGYLLLGEGDLERAERHLQKAKVLDVLWYDDRPDLFLGDLADARGQLKSAIEQYIEVMLRSRGESRRVWAHIAGFLEGHPGQETYLRTQILRRGMKVLDDHPHPELALGLANLARDEGESDLAQSLCKRALELSETEKSFQRYQPTALNCMQMEP